MVDTSLLIDVLLPVPGLEATRLRLFADEVQLCSPSVQRLEILQALQKLLIRRALSEVRAHELFVQFGDLGIHYYSEEPLVARIWKLRGNLSAYDAAYVALAESLRAPLLTRDQRLARTPGTRAAIEFVPLTSTA